MLHFLAGRLRMLRMGRFAIAHAVIGVSGMLGWSALQGEAARDPS